MEYMKKLLSRNKEESRIRVHNVTDYDETYVYPKKVMRMVGLRITGITATDSPSIRNAFHIYYWVQFANILLSLALNICKFRELFTNFSFDDITKVFRMLPCIGYLVLAILKSYKMILQRSVYENLISELRVMWPQGSVPQEDHTILSRGLKELNLIVKGYYICNYLLGISSIAPPYVDVIKRATGEDIPRVLPFNYWMPYNDTAPGYFEFTLTLQAWHTMLTLCFMLCGDLLFCIFLSHITTQFELLSARIRRLVFVPIDQQLIPEYPLGGYCKDLTKAEGDSQSFLYINEVERKCEIEMVQIIIRHRALIRLAKDVEDLFSFSLLLNFFYSSIIICFCGFCSVRIEKLNVFMYKSFLTTSLCQIWLLCWFGQKLLDSSRGISKALYESGWYMASKKIKKLVLIMMHRSQKEVRVTTYGFSTISLASYTSIIKTAWSYFTLLMNTFQPN